MSRSKKEKPRRSGAKCIAEGRVFRLPQMANSGGGGRFLRQRAIATRVLLQNNRCPLFPALSCTARSAREEEASLAVNFREVVHSVRTGNADVAKL